MIKPRIFNKYRVALISAWVALGVITVADATTAPSAFSARTPMVVTGLTAPAGATFTPTPRSEELHPRKSFVTSAVLQKPGASGIAQQMSALVSAQEQPQPLISNKQQAQMQDLLAQQGGQFKIHFDHRNGTPSYLEGRFAAAAGAKAKGRAGGRDTVRAFLGTHRALFKLKNPDAELKLVREETDSGKRTHLIYQQTYQGVPVWGKQLLAHLEADNTLYLVNGRYLPSPALLNTTPKLDAASALAVVTQALNAPNAEVLESELVIYPGADGQQTLAYRIDVRPSILDRWVYFVDAMTGTVVHTIHNIHAAGSTVDGGGTDSHKNAVTFKVWSENNKFYMVDPTYPSATVPADPLQSPSPSGDTYVLDAKNGDGKSLSFITSNSATSGWDEAAVNAMHNTRVVYDYYKTTHSRDSIDGEGKNLLVMIHTGSKMNNAFWTGTFMVYGDGDDAFLSQTTKCLDVAGHEMTHGVIQSTAGLIYENQSGALNESFADVFGAMVDRSNWTMGEDCTAAAPHYLRSLQDPHLGVDSQPAKMSEYKNLPATEAGDNGGVHANSGIPNHAAYLTWQNLGGDEIAKQKLEKIYYAALTLYLAPSSLFVDARRALSKAAQTIYGVVAAKAVDDAWDSVEVTSATVATPNKIGPTAADPVTGPDIMLFLSPTSVAGGQKYELYMQHMTNPASFDGPLNAGDKYLAYTRPVAYTGQNGTVVFFVGEDHNLYANAVGGVPQLVNNSGKIASIALAPNGHYFAYTTTDAADKNIHVVDLNSATETEQAWPLAPPNYQQGQVTVANTIYYADAMSFDYTGRTLVFDALNCVSTPQSVCTADQTGGYQFWSIGLMDIATGEQFYPFPSQDPAIDIGNPAFAANNSYIIAFDVINYTDPNAPFSRVLSANLDKNTAAEIISYSGVAQSGVASFWGDDTAVTVQYPSTNGNTAVGIPLNADGSGDVARAITLNDYISELPAMHRQGVRTASGGLQSSAAMLDFGSVTVGVSKDVTLSLSNTSDRDITISGIAISSIGFTHNATNTLLPRGSSLDIRVTYTPVDAQPIVGTLAINTDSAPAKMEISLVANGGGKAAAPPNTNSESKGLFGCTLGTGANDPMFPMLLLSAMVALWRRSQKSVRR
ncbi:MAG: M4 family metallopeptidase [Pseudomonadota bacterium]